MTPKIFVAPDMHYLGEKATEEKEGMEKIIGKNSVVCGHGTASMVQPPPLQPPWYSLQLLCSK